MLGCSAAPGALQLTTNPGSLLLDSTDPYAALKIRNTSNREVALKSALRGSSERIKFGFDSATLAPGQTAEVIVRFDYRGFERGQLLTDERVEVRTAGGVQVIPLKFEMRVGGLDTCGIPQRSFPPERSVPQVERSGAYVPNEILVQYTLAQTLASQPASSTAPSLADSGVRSALSSVAQEVAGDFGLDLMRTPTLHRPTLVRAEASDLTAEIARLEADPRVAYAEPNYYLELSADAETAPLTASLPDDPLLAQQWNLLEFGVPRAWAAQGRNSVTLAVIDSGVDPRHEDLAAKLLPGCDFFSGDGDAAPGYPGLPKAEHGTHVAGIAAAAGNNAKGVTGVAYGANIKVVPVKVFDRWGAGGTLNSLLEAITWAAGFPVEGVRTNEFPADIINMSLGTGEQLSPNGLRSVDEVTKRVYDAGVTMIAAAGNSKTKTGLKPRLHSPASSPWVIAVGSVNADRRRASSSIYTAKGPSVDVVAPGGSSSLSECGGVLSSVPGGESFPNGGYGCQQGTSMAAPFVSGVAALLLTQTWKLKPDVIKKRLRSTALFDRTFMTRRAYGAGVVCADRALGAATRCGK